MLREKYIETKRRLREQKRQVCVCVCVCVWCLGMLMRDASCVMLGMWECVRASV